MYEKIRLSWKRNNCHKPCGISSISILRGTLCVIRGATFVLWPEVHTIWTAIYSSISQPLAVQKGGLYHTFYNLDLIQHNANPWKFLHSFCSFQLSPEFPIESQKTNFLKNMLGCTFLHYLMWMIIFMKTYSSLWMCWSPERLLNMQIFDDYWCKCIWWKEC